jgi:uncharacterized ferredoxin-like protein
MREKHLGTLRIRGTYCNCYYTGAWKCHSANGMNDETAAVETVAGLMALSARTAPKARGTDVIVTRVVKRDGLPLLAKTMRSIGDARGIVFFLRDAANVEQSDSCLLIGARKEPTAGIDCGACGFATCGAMLKFVPAAPAEKNPMRGPNCAVRMVDLGVAVGSAVKTAQIHNVDNRVMYSCGVAALSLGWLEGCQVGYGIPLKASGKNIYFDRMKV